MVPELIAFPGYVPFQSNFIPCMPTLPLHVPQMDQAKLERSKSLCKHQYRQLIRKHSKINNEAPRKVNTTKRKKKRKKKKVLQLAE